MTTNLTKQEQETLITVARETIIHYIGERAIPPVADPGSGLRACRGCFVTLKQDGTLRGCIGSFVTDKPLYQTVQEMAIAAATRDPRFYPMKTADLDNFTLEISVLSPLEKISSIDEIEVGIHGIYLEKNHCRGVLLPQVAVEYGWDRLTFLGQTCLKAGLKRDDWQEGADIYIFSAQVFD